jgi:hypothetical protein
MDAWFSRSAGPSIACNPQTFKKIALPGNARHGLVKGRFNLICSGW